MQHVCLREGQRKFGILRDQPASDFVIWLKDIVKEKEGKENPTEENPPDRSVGLKFHGALYSKKAIIKSKTLACVCKFHR